MSVNMKSSSQYEISDTMNIILNGKLYNLGSDVPVTTTLLQFIREHALLTGTKGLCYEGGCGVCTVVADIPDAEKGGRKIISLQACQALVYSCDGWSIETVEHIGNNQIGLNRFQNALVGFSATQCGYCSPGFILTMQGQKNSTKDLKMSQIEKSLDGNICRCTGYRSILDAFKSFAIDAPQHLRTKLADIEECYKEECSKTGRPCKGHCKKEIQGICDGNELNIYRSKTFDRNDLKWYRPITLVDVFAILSSKKSNEKIRIVVGNTGQGIFNNDGPYNIYINTTGIKELYEVADVSIGANVSLQRCVEIFRDVASRLKGYKHLQEVAKHWEIVANVGVRNLGSWAGNLMLKHDHPGFCSDIFLSLVAVEAKLKIGSIDSTEAEISIEEFTSLDMEKRLILSMTIPPQPENVQLRTFKVTPRAVNTHAYANACFRFHICSSDEMRVETTPCIAIGGINPSFIHAAKTERFLVGKSLKDFDDVCEAIKLLGSEIKPLAGPQDASPAYRISLVQSLFYKTIIGILGNFVSSNIISGGLDLQRPISSGQQIYDSNENSWPIGQPILKLESESQITGEAEYLDDIASLPNEVYGAFLQSNIARAKIISIDASQCLNLPGVLNFITAKDIPGANSFTSFPKYLPDPLFAEDEVVYAGQSIGLVVALSRSIALEAVKLVKVVYDEIQTPVLTIEEAKRKNRVYKTKNLWDFSLNPIIYGEVEAGFKNSKHVIEGSLSLGSQFHFATEPLTARVVPIEDGFDVYCTSQWPTETQSSVANVLGISANSINICVRRLGGAFGGKITRQNIVSAAAAVAAYKLQRPVRITLDLSTNMTLVGWRQPYYSKYKVGFNDDGKFESIDVDIFCDAGHIPNEPSAGKAAWLLPNIYHCPNWKIQPYVALTDTAANTFCRAPGHVQAMATMENIVEHVAEFLKKDPLLIREANFETKYKPQVLAPKVAIENVVKTTILPMLKSQARIEDRKQNIKEFNEVNRWRKRGLSLLPMRYAYRYDPIFHYNAQVVIFEHDGTVAIKHGGIEMGQGINTKIAQVAAKILNIPLDFVKVKPTDVFSGANSSVTARSMGSDLNAHGVKICCERLRERIDVILNKINKESNRLISWSELVKRCFQEQVDLSERYYTFGKEHPESYDIWACAAVEVELDVLTGQFLVLRADIIEDCGRSLNPYVDVGQIEGAFVMGIGLFTSEKVKYDSETGKKVSNSTWEYQPPTALDIPVDFRVSLLPKGDNSFGVVRSKASGEPALCLAYAVVTALRQAIKSARADAGEHGWFDLHTPLTVERIHQLCKVNLKQFAF